MTENDVRMAVIAVNNTLATNNPKGLTEALRAEGFKGDAQFDILSYDTLNSGLLELFALDPRRWERVVKSVEFNYEKTDSSTSQNTRTLFENIIRAYDPNYTASSSTAKGTPAWLQTAIGFIAGSTTTTTVGTSPSGASKVSTWVYVGLTVLGLLIVGLVVFAIIQLRKQ